MAREVWRLRVTCVDDAFYLDAGVVQLFGESVDGLDQVLARLRVNVGPPGGDLNCGHTPMSQPQPTVEENNTGDIPAHRSTP